MEVRIIDPKSESSQNARGVQGTVIRVIHPKHHPAPSPYRFLIKRALKPIHHAGETGRESFLANSSHETDEDFSSPPATDHQNAGIVRTDSRGSPRECQSAPSYPAPNSNLWEASWFIVGLVGFLSFAVVAINYGGSTLGDTALTFMAITFFTWLLLSPDTLSENQNAEVEGHTLFLLRKTSSEQTSSSQNFPPPASAPESKQNAGSPEKFVPPGMESRSPCASRSSNSTEVIGSGKSDSPFRSFLSYLWSKFFVSPFLTSGFDDPTMERVNGVWRKKA